MRKLLDCKPLSVQMKLMKPLFLKMIILHCRKIYRRILLLRDGLKKNGTTQNQVSKNESSNVSVHNEKVPQFAGSFLYLRKQ